MTHTVTLIFLHGTAALAVIALLAAGLRSRQPGQSRKPLILLALTAFGWHLGLLLIGLSFSMSARFIGSALALSYPIGIFLFSQNFPRFAPTGSPLFRSPVWLLAAPLMAAALTLPDVQARAWVQVNFESLVALIAFVLAVPGPALALYRLRPSLAQADSGPFERVSRSYLQLHTMVTVLAAGIVLGVASIVLLPILGWQRHLYLAGMCIGPPVIITALLIAFQPRANLRGLLPRLLFYQALATLGAALLFLAAQAYLVRQGYGSLPMVFFYASAFVFTGLVAAVLLLHSKFQKNSIQMLFMRDAFAKERVLTGFAGEIQALEDTEESLEGLLEVILQNMYSTFRFDKGLIVISDRSGNNIYRHIGSASFLVSGQEPEIPVRRVRLSPEYADELDRVFLLEDGSPLPFADNPEAGAKFPRLTERIGTYVESFRRSGFRIFVPVIFKREWWGVILLGEKTDGLPYYAGELRMLENTRAAFAMSIRNNAVVERILRQKHEAETMVVQAAQAVAVEQAAAPPVRLRLGRRTLVYSDPIMADTVEKTRNIAGMPLPVLIQGETGAGKELFARLLHKEGGEESRPFVAVNCSAVPHGLWESEIFGHVKGAFTDARADRPGMVEQARGGVLFFDEIGEMPLDVQPKILRLIQEKQYMPVGGKRVMEADCRLVFATHRDLAAMVRDGRFREDLYYRINVFHISVPSLRERGADIPHLVENAIRTNAEELHSPIRDVDPEAMKLLAGYSWPGNIRELENVVIRLMAQVREETLGPEHLPDEIRKAPAGGGRPTRRSTDREERATPRQREIHLPERIAQLGFEKLMSEYAREIIIFALKRCKGNRTHAANLLNISRGKLIYQMKELAIENPVKRGSAAARKG